MKYMMRGRPQAFMLAVLLLVSACAKPAPQEPGEPQTSAPQEQSQPEPEPPIEGALTRPALAGKISEGVLRNKDTVGWIYMPGTEIDNAVLQYSDNSYYLNLNEDKKYDVFGCYFMDFESRQGTGAQMSRNNIIYGHSDLRDNKNGKRFSQLFHYTDLEFLKEHPYIYYSTREEEMVWQIFAVFYTRIDFYYIEADPNNARFANIVSEAKLRSEYIIDVPVADSDKILTLSTCTVNYKPGDKDNYRLVIMAKLLPPDKQLAPTVNAQVNPNPKRSW